MTGIPRNVRCLLEEHSWEDTSARLLRHADNKIRRLIWRAEKGGHPPGGVEADDVVQTVYEKVLSGTRKWNPDRDPNLFEYLRDQVDSETSNLVRSAENRLFRRETPNPDAAAEVNDRLTTESGALANEEERSNDEFFFGFFDFLKEEPDLQRVVEVIVDGVRKPAEIAQELGVRVEEIYSARKKLARRLQDYRARRHAAIAPSEGGTTHA